MRLLIAAAVLISTALTPSVAHARVLANTATTQDPQRLTLAESRGAARTAVNYVADLFVEGRPRSTHRCERLSETNVVCRTRLRAPGLRLRYLTYVNLLDVDTLQIYIRQLRIVKQPGDPFP